MKPWLGCGLFLYLALTLTARPVHIEVDQTRPPISKYIYGQFIEHLGRCIYGGLWAEMLEDRKFFYPVSDDYAPWAVDSDNYWGAGPYRYLCASPWKTIGKRGCVIMERINPYVGQQAVRVLLPADGSFAGIAQEGLSVLAGRKYTGRIVLGSDNELTIHIRLRLDEATILERQLTAVAPDYRSYRFEFTVPQSASDVTLKIVARGQGSFRIGTVSLMPADNLDGWRPEVIALLRELDAPIYRWPGGNFVSGYNWRDGIGERDRRPPRKNPAWKGVEPNDVGIHEYMDLMARIGAEPFIAVNTGLGDAADPADEVEYCNGAAATAMGSLRAANGRREPFSVRYWAVGNEMYGDWQLGHMPLPEYLKKHKQVVDGMRRVDRSIALVGVGAVGEWSRTMLEQGSEHMDLISEHIYRQDKTDTPEHIGQLAADIRRVAEAHRAYRREIPGLGERDIRIAMDEWNYWYGDYLYGELGVRYHHRDALGVARGLHEYFRNSDIYFMANYAQTVNVIGCIKTTATTAAFDATGLPLVLYRRHFGTVPVAVTGDTGSCDLVAALTDDQKHLTLAVVNPLAAAQRLEIDFRGAAVADPDRRWQIRHSDPLAFNEPGKEPRLKIVEEKPSAAESGTLTLPPYSISLYRYPVNNGK